MDLSLQSAVYQNKYKISIPWLSDVSIFQIRAKNSVFSNFKFNKNRFRLQISCSYFYGNYTFSAFDMKNGF